MNPDSRAQVPGSPEEWLEHAESDLRLAQLASRDPAIRREQACFHAQQAAEKSIKAILRLDGIGFPLTDNIEHALALAERQGLVLTDEVRKAGVLTPYAVETRYPGPWPEVGESELAGDPNVPVVNRDPEAFFRATHLTADLRKVFEEVLGSLAGKSGYNRMLKLRTPFGGGKSHTLAALDHAARKRSALDLIPEAKDFPRPGDVAVAVFDGEKFDERTRTGQRRAKLLLPGQHSRQRGVPQLLVVVEVFIAQRQAVDPLRHHLVEPMLELIRPAVIGETPSQTLQQADAPLGLPQQQTIAVGGQRPGIKGRRDPPRKMGFKLEAVLGTLCHSESRTL